MGFFSHSSLEAEVFKKLNLKNATFRPFLNRCVFEKVVEGGYPPPLYTFVQLHIAILAILAILAIYNYIVIVYNYNII